MTINSDFLRHPGQIAFAYDRALVLLRDAGYREIAQFDPQPGGAERVSSIAEMKLREMKLAR